MAQECDVLVIGGGPAGTTVGALLKRYQPSLRVLIVEREAFPRQHIGESQLSAVCRVLNEMGVWDKVEAAGFPVKIGSAYRWGTTDELWHVNFLPDEFKEEPRPGRFAGQRALTAFQVDRSIYDKILLDHARDVGCEVREQTQAVEVHKDGDRIESIGICPAKGSEGEPETIAARYYVDASGQSAYLQREMGVSVDSPTSLRNVAFWDYWQNAEWAYSVGNGGTRALILSLGWGWVWFIPITSTRTSIGLVTPASYYKDSKKTGEELYLRALAEEPRVSQLIRNAQRENIFQATKDWSYIADRLYGENWFLVGDTCGFADPILSAGMTLAQVGARKAAYTILELERKELDAKWLKSEYNDSHRANIRQHIQFADYWYAANGRFTELREYCAELAKEAGLDLSPHRAFQWIGTGGFAGDTIAEIGALWAGFETTRNVIKQFSGSPMTWQIGKNNRFCLNLDGSKPGKVAVYRGGRVMPVQCLRREGKILPMVGQNEFVCSVVGQVSDANEIVRQFRRFFGSNPQKFPKPEIPFRMAIEAWETLIAEGWITASENPDEPFLNLV
ncbi:MAG TPA: NAD(P)/FAD-dependent oxidoreductase [Fimbriimonadaceae bacterium]|nr:NAD(P)/FAD-dependent oxidoreductase [Fimbriimonadaceae bacterium]